eukprot:Ihof_evm2s155 gene=Ihof_evmTU2s155
MMLALAGTRKYHLGQLDIRSAYLHTHPDTPVYMEQSPMHRDPERTDYAEPCLYICHDPKQGFLALVIYMDDIFICAEHESEMKDLIKTISAKFPTKDIGVPSSLLGYSIAKTSES